MLLGVKEVELPLFVPESVVIKEAIQRWIIFVVLGQVEDLFVFRCAFTFDRLGYVRLYMILYSWHILVLDLLMPLQVLFFECVAEVLITSFYEKVLENGPVHNVLRSEVI